ncbi:siderophore-interacting protein [Actinotalea sp. M2MS4P-6]|uniref:siderophore-interacting protein n=1 Tax=Actinotalea sp. M2MS4P-6 TaxID=2983762 RepID=UPI0021E4E16C|nr:siderophore-interacting protein [Actinotalea sp. M2MS4P-6]MCV2394337.1 siderophore-interacting protein [Actinotalea sp. M2MS4P-6]
MAQPAEQTPGRAPSIVERVPHTPRRRVLEVVEVEELSPTMRRFRLAGDDLEPDFPFVPLGATDHVKLVLPDEATGEVTLPEGGPAPDGPPMREYTIRGFRDGSLVLDFVLHEHGPAGRWAASATVGSRLGVLGPRGSQVHPTWPTHYLLVADPTAFAAAERFCEELPATTRVSLVALGLDGSPARPLGPDGRADVTWIETEDLAEAAGRLLAAVARIPLDDRTVAWGAGEAGVMRSLRGHLRDRGLPAERVLVRGYWRHGWSGSLPREDR